MRVAIDATPLLGQPTGVGAFTAGVLAALAARDDVSPIAFALTWRGRQGLSTVSPRGVATATRPMPARPLRALWRRAAWPTVEWWTGRVDAVHGTNFVVPPTRGAAVVTVHDLTALRFPELCEPSTLAFPDLVRAAARRGAWVHAVSARVAEEVVADLGISSDRVVTVHEGVPDVPPAPPGEGVARAGGRYVLALGTIEPRKDHVTLLRAFEAVARGRDVRLVVAGARGWGAEDFDRAVARSPVRERVVPVGYVGAPTRAALLRDASALAYPSTYEGFGLPPLEAMSVGVPVVATAAGALPEVLGDAACMVPVGDADALAAALAAVLDDDTTRTRLVAAGRARAARYSWSACAEGLVELYRAAGG